jgi:hypothetical protein
MTVPHERYEGDVFDGVDFATIGKRIRRLTNTYGFFEFENSPIDAGLYGDALGLVVDTGEPDTSWAIFMSPEISGVFDLEHADPWEADEPVLIFANEASAELAKQQIAALILLDYPVKME